MTIRRLTRLTLRKKLSLNVTLSRRRENEMYFIKFELLLTIFNKTNFISSFHVRGFFVIKKLAINEANGANRVNFEELWELFS